MPEIKATRPFDMGYVLRTTAKHMRISIDISIRKTFEKSKVVGEDGLSVEQSKVFRTLSHLHTLRKMLDDYQREHTEDFKGE
jgi:hypothetical protein